MTATTRSRKKQHAMAARQALTLCEAELAGSRWHQDSPAQASTPSLCRQPRARTAAASAALRAAGVPPYIAARLRRRLHLLTEQESDR